MLPSYGSYVTAGIHKERQRTKLLNLQFLERKIQTYCWRYDIYLRKKSYSNWITKILIKWIHKLPTALYFMWMFHLNYLLQDKLKKQRGKKKKKIMKTLHIILLTILCINGHSKYALKKTHTIQFLPNYLPSIK